MNSLVVQWLGPRHAFEQRSPEAWPKIKVTILVCRHREIFVVLLSFKGMSSCFGFPFFFFFKFKFSCCCSEFFFFKVSGSIVDYNAVLVSGI